MANKKMTWKKFVVNTPDNKVATVELDEKVFGIPSIEVKHTLTMNEMISFVSDVVSMCVDEDSAEYTPASYDFAIRLCVMNYYAGIPMPSGSDSAVHGMLETAYSVLYETDLYDRIIKNVNDDQFFAMTDAVDEHIRYMRDMLVSSAARKSMELISKMDEMMRDSKNVLDQIDSENFAKAVEHMSQLAALDVAQSTQRPATSDIPADLAADVVGETLMKPIISGDVSADNIVLMRPGSGKKK